MFNPSRAQARQFLCDVWQKELQQRPMTPLEHMGREVILLHPEYQKLLTVPDRQIDRDFPVGLGQTNPFLHLLMHLSIREQLSIDQPAGLTAQYWRLTHQLGDPHAAEHAIMDCLAEMLWQAQKYQTPFEAQMYLRCIASRYS